MTRFLTVVLSLTIVAVALATPAVACVSTPTLGSEHGCCGEQAVITPAPVGICCVLSQPTSDRALTGVRNLAAKERLADIGTAHPPVWSAVGDATVHRRARSTSPPGPSTVPIYIQQLSLLI
jgi:hypothetical protein